MEWKDITTYSKNDEERVPSVWNISIGGMRVCVHRHIGYAKDDWLLSTYFPGFFDRKLLQSKDIEKAKYEALMLVRDRANEISGSVTVALMSEDKNEIR